MRAVQTTTAKSSPTRPKRVWVAGRKLIDAGLPAGTLINVNYLQERKTIHITRDINGTRAVSKNGKVEACIDLQNATVDGMFDEGERLQIIVMDGEVVIQPLREDTNQVKREAEWQERSASGQIRHASMFTGGGVSTQAIHDGLPGSKLAWIAELESRYIESAGANCKAVDDDTVWLQGPVEQMDGRYFTSVDLLSFSMPCAGFSKSGKAKHGLSEEAHSGTAVFGVVRAIQQSNPAVIISENVPEAQDSAIYLLLKAELVRLGYTLFEQVLDQSHTGSIEQRKRYWLTAFSSGISPEHFEISELAAATAPLSTILEEDAPESLWSENTGLNSKAERDAAKGSNFKRQLLTGDELTIGTIGRYYNKKRSTEPFIVRADGMERILTPTEHAAAKQIPAHLIAGLPKSTAHEILGQSVLYGQPLRIAQAIGGAL